MYVQEVRASNITFNKRPSLFYGCRIIPESPRWLVQKERTEEAKAIFEKMAKINKRDVPDQIIGALMSEKVPQEESLWNIFKSWPVTWRFMVLAFNW